MSIANWKYEEIPFSNALDLEEGYTLGWFGPQAWSTVAASWNAQAGVFLFLKANAGIDGPLLASKLRAFLKEPIHAKVRFLWIHNPRDLLNQWRFNSISVNNGKVSRTAYLDMNNYSLSIAKGTAISVQSNQFYFSRVTDDLKGFALSSEHGFHKIYDLGSTLKLDMLGDSRGCFSFTLAIKMALNKKELTFGYPGFTHLDVSLRMFFRDSDFPSLHEDYYLASNRYPVFDESHPLLSHASPEASAFLENLKDIAELNDQSWLHKAFEYYPQTITFTVSLDFLYPLSRERSYFEFIPSTLPEEEDPGMPSSFRTNRGYTIHLFPQSSGSRLVFSPRPATRQASDMASVPLYLVPSGRFNSKIIDYDESTIVEGNVICGISGVEYIKIVEGTHFHFKEDQPAFAPNYLSVRSLLRDLTAILESYAARSLPPDETDLDIRIEDKEVGEAEEAMGITDKERMEILEVIRKDYFPPGFTFSPKAIAEYQQLEYVEDMIAWLQAALQAAPINGNNTLTSNPNIACETSWLYFEDTPDLSSTQTNAIYYAQPDQAILYKPTAVTASAGEDELLSYASQEFLSYMEVPAVVLPHQLTEEETSGLEATTGNATLAFPMLPYGNIDPYQLTDMIQLEILLINNFRRSRIQRISDPLDSEAGTASLSASSSGAITRDASANVDLPSGITPQGLLATYSTDYSTIRSLQLAKDTKGKLIEFTDIRQLSPLKASLQSNQLFMVATKVEEIRKYETLNPEINGGKNVMDIQDWLFELGSDHWARKGTILVIKFHNKSLLEIASQPDLWSMPDKFNDDPQTISDQLVALLKEAVEFGKSDDIKERQKYELLAQAATQPNWMGILAFNVDVPLKNLPDALKALAAGMDADKFYAQYIGIEVTRIETKNGDFHSKKSSLFGLIDYKNPQIPVMEPEAKYNFHVPFLSIVFQNSLIVAFAAEVWIVMEELFREAATLLGSTTNTLVLKGVAEDHEGKTTYSFGFSGENVFQLSGHVLDEIEIVKASFVTGPPAAPTISPNESVQHITGRFLFWGRLRYAYHHEFDILSFGKTPGISEENAPQRDYLNLNNLQVTMDFDLRTTDTTAADGTLTTTSAIERKEFEFVTEQMVFDLDRSGWRLQSLYEKFPLKFTGFTSTSGDPTALSKSGFMEVSSSLTSVSLDGGDWYGLTYDLNLGSVGALAGGAGLVASILVAWVPESAGVFVGLKLPGSVGGKKEISIQGLLKISFKSIQFVTYPKTQETPPLDNSTEREVGYLLKLKNIVLKFMALSLPPSGQTEIILFGDSRDEIARKDKLLGWYAAYAKK